MCLLYVIQKLQEKIPGYGAPTIAIEVLSKSNSRHDLEVKYGLYEEAGVKEYWIIFPKKKIIRINYLDKKSKYSKVKEFNFTDEIKVKILGDFVFQLERKEKVQIKNMCGVNYLLSISFFIFHNSSDKSTQYL